MSLEFGLVSHDSSPFFMITWPGSRILIFLKRVCHTQQYNPHPIHNACSHTERVITAIHQSVAIDCGHILLVWYQKAPELHWCATCPLRCIQLLTTSALWAVTSSKKQVFLIEKSQIISVNSLDQWLGNRGRATRSVWSVRG